MCGRERMSSGSTSASPMDRYLKTFRFGLNTPSSTQTFLTCHLGFATLGGKMGVKSGHNIMMLLPSSCESVSIIMLLCPTWTAKWDGFSLLWMISAWLRAPWWCSPLITVSRHMLGRRCQLRHDFLKWVKYIRQVSVSQTLWMCRILERNTVWPPDGSVVTQHCAVTAF